MPIYGIKQRPDGCADYYESSFELARDEYVMLETEYGVGIGSVVSGPIALLPGFSGPDLPKVKSIATAEEKAQYHRNRDLEKLAYEFCKQRIKERNLEMKLVDVEVYYDRSKLIFYFTAPTRIDFRELVKDLVREYRARIELRQIGARHETQMLGAIGNCGQVCCCRRHLRKFAPVTIRMAKEQRLFLNPAKISGICGRLLCCLSYEQENYEKFHQSSPRTGKRYHTAKGVLKVTRVNMFKNSITVLDDENQELTFTKEEWDELKPWRSCHDDPDTVEKDDACDYGSDYMDCKDINF